MRAKRSVKAKSVDDYLKVMPEDARVALEKLRKIIKAAAPETTEVISYRIPISSITVPPWSVLAQPRTTVRSTL